MSLTNQDVLAHLKESRSPVSSDGDLGPTVIVGGIPTSVYGRTELTDLVVRTSLVRRTQAEAIRGPAMLMFDSNGQGLAMAQGSPQFRDWLLAADVVHADGQPVVIASRLLGRKAIRERSATTDLFHDICAAAVPDGLRMYLLGGSEEVNSLCAAKMQALYPGLVIAGRRNGYFTREEEADVIAEINAARPDVVWVGLGKPKEQGFSVRNRRSIDATWLITCGGCYNFVTGHYSRAPRWMQAVGLEWAYRALKNPKKLGMRYLVTNPVALWMLLSRTR
jgi:N-acetylglucosaminyldiphosphoundecaprenol N-acetyl-beta-D-mannosaminyltransferase